MKPLVSFIGIGAAGLVAIATMSVTRAFADEGRPVSANDISGKKFCSNTGHWVQFGADGRASTDLGHHPIWSVPQTGVVKTGYGERQIEVLLDGQLYQRRIGRHGRNQDRWLIECA
jgi:hypothetical protein